MRPTLQTHAVRRRPGWVKIDTPEQLITAFEARHGDRVLLALVKVAAMPETFTAELTWYHKAICLVIHRDVGRARVFRGETV